MLSLQMIREHRAAVLAGLALKRFADAETVVARIEALDAQRRQWVTDLDTKRAEMNTIAKEVGTAMAQKDTARADGLKAQTGVLKEAIAQGEAQLRTLDDKLNAELVKLPNLPHASVPAGGRAEDNVEIRSGGLVPILPPNAQPHWELAKRLGLIDFELGVKITGAGFPVYQGAGARLQRALINFFLDRATAAGYGEVMPPLLVNADSGFGTGQLPDKDGQMYYVGEDQLYLIPTAEVPITNMFRDVILGADELPVRRCGYTPCFRREAGSYGKDVRGLNRLHQFDKVEIVWVSEPEHSYAALEVMMAHVESLVQELELPYRILLLCGGDMSFTSAKTYDFEVYSAAQERWLEVSSVSNFEDYQANRLKLRYKPAGQKRTVTLHTLNGSALALPRIVAALLENHQQADGSIRIPAALVPYFGAERIG
jgi:seryl-tRNA synthetase